METGKESVINVVDTDKLDELEGFAFGKDFKTGVAVSSSRKNNVSLMDFDWE